MSLTPQLKQFLFRIGIFLLFFLILTGIVGPWVVRSKLLYGFHFFIYGNMGKLLIFSILTFFILAREKIRKISVSPFEKKQVLFLIASFLLIPVFFSFAHNLLQQSSFTANILLSLVTHATLLLITILPVFGVFGTKFVVYFLREFRKEVLVCIGLAAVLYLMIFQVWKLWPYLADVVLLSAEKIFSLFFPIVRVAADRRILVQSFVVRIDEACSGIEGIFLFTVLYILISVTDFKKMNKKKLLLMFLPSVAGLFLTNVLRVNILIAIGVLWSPKLALELFHTYAGLMFFVLYFIVFWRYLYKWFLK